VGSLFYLEIISFVVQRIFNFKENFNKYEKIEIAPCILLDHNAIKIKNNNKSNSRKYTNNWRVNNKLLNDLWVTEEINEKIKRFLEFNEN
jgi:hypothetical protein